MSELIKPRVLKGFRDFLPEEEIARRTALEKLEEVFRSFGFAPIDTPALEYEEILLGKGGGETDKQVYRFKDGGGRDVALRFDLTVPFARFVSEHRAEILFPFKRYHIAKVWRGENTQRGRYREFIQCDFDIISRPGSGADSARGDFEILLLIKEALLACVSQNESITSKNAAAPITILVNHRALFNRFLRKLGAGEKLVPILRCVDKILKTGKDAVLQEISAFTNENDAKKIIDYVSFDGNWDDTLKMMTEAAGGENEDSRQLDEIRRFIEDTGGGAFFRLAPSITRGLDYYTGVVFETFLNEAPEIGSICTGGRYDNLVSLYSKDPLSGVGASVGVDRLLAALAALGKLPQKKSYAICAVLCRENASYGRYQALAGRLRENGIGTEVFCEAAKKLTDDFIFAEKRGIPFVIIPPREGEAALFGLRTLKDRTTKEELSESELISEIKSNLRA